MRHFILLLALGLCNLVLAQTVPDSVVFTKTPWKTTDLGNGLTWKQFHFNEKQLFQANQHLNLVETKLKNRKVQFAFVSADSVGTSPKKLIKTSQLAKQAGALAAVNGTFFDTKNFGSVDKIKINGQVVDTTRWEMTASGAEHQKAAITIHRNKIALEVGQRQGWDKQLTADNVMVTGPLLLQNGERVPLKKAAFNDNRHPRTCACVTYDKRLILLTVDGRTPQAYGMSLHELSSVMKWLGCKDAINFDGGGSTTLYIANQPDAGVVNMPCDNKLFDHFGERAVSNIMAILPK
ncbi:MAG: phosphodiester glycosidase family protein [Spirosomataceae bacterium]